ncbi:MAG TPA: MepB family protein [Rickettsia endosymbiont of Sericostoma sp.]|uniref:MepB family protein n=2 Tax=unclassified Candidatus Tisiphia TaxID=2996318 RepID=UPI001D9A67D4|nr:MepB family protein [Rickettsia endosymbiont of Sericostoma sp.]
MNNLICNRTNNSWSTNDLIHSELIVSRDLIYNPCQFRCSEPVIEKESAEYGAYIFKLNSMNVRFRVAKITPTKIGQFVTLWKRMGNGPIQPYDTADSIDLFIVTTRKGDNFGQFIFPQSVLYKYDIVSHNNQGGKRAIRVYPPWDIVINKQAKKTQAWQLEYFLEIPGNKPINYERVQMLYNQVK